MKTDKSVTQIFIEILTVVGAMSGMFLAVFWITGRAFATGYFDSMNIPSYYVRFSIWEYAEVSWWIQISLVLLFIIVCCIYYFIVEQLKKYLILFFKPLIIKFLGKINLDSKPKENRITSELKILFLISYFCLVGLFLIFIILIMLSLNTYIGKEVGRDVVLNNNKMFDFVTMTPIDIDEKVIISSPDNKETNYLYKGFKLLTYNEDRYFFYNSIDSTDNKPKAVYIVDAKNILQLKITKEKINKSNKLPNKRLNPTAPPEADRPF